jgi:hypothetical protein
MPGSHNHEVPINLRILGVHQTPDGGRIPLHGEVERECICGHGADELFAAGKTKGVFKDRSHDF